MNQNLPQAGYNGQTLPGAPGQPIGGAGDSAFEVEMGTTVSRDPIAKFKMGHNQRTVITVLSPKPFVTKTHYQEGVGFFYADDATQKAGLQVRLHYNFIVCEYECDKRGVVQLDQATGMPMFEIKYLAAGNELYQDLVTKFEIHGALSNLALLVTCTEEKYQNYSLEVMGPAYHTQNPQFQQILVGEFTRLAPYLKQVIAKPLTAEMRNKVLGNAGDPNDNYADLHARQGGNPQQAAPGFAGQPQQAAPGFAGQPQQGFHQGTGQFQQGGGFGNPNPGFGEQPQQAAPAGAPAPDSGINPNAFQGQPADFGGQPTTEASFEDVPQQAAPVQQEAAPVQEAPVQAPAQQAAPEPQQAAPVQQEVPPKQAPPVQQAPAQQEAPAAQPGAAMGQQAGDDPFGVSEDFSDVFKTPEG